MAKSSKSRSGKSLPPQFTLGLDFGTNSARALIVDVRDGSEIGSGVFAYPSGEAGILLDPKDPHLARQNPADYLLAIEKTTKQAIKQAKKVKGFSVDRIIGIGVDATASTPIPVDKTGTPLCFQERFKDDLAAHAWLWRDHTANAEAKEITELARLTDPAMLDKVGGTYSSEWLWSKLLRAARKHKRVFKAAHSWVEQVDYLAGYLVGATDPTQLKRSICAAGHKGMYHEQWGGLPPKTFLNQLEPGLAALRDRMYEQAYACDAVAGRLDATVAKKLGLGSGGAGVPGVPVAVGLIDAHAGAAGAGVKPGTLVKVLGTSSCDMMVAALEDDIADIPGISGIVPESILPGHYGIEAGQSAVGDIFNWFVNHLVPAEFSKKGDAHANLTAAASVLKPGQSGLLALDWNNGNRNILADHNLDGLLLGQTLHTTAPEIFRALIEATAFGALTIIRQIESHGVPVKQVINCGGIAEKNPMVMQIYADICNRPMKLARSSQTCAMGAAISAAVVGGAYKSVPAAQRKMTGVSETVYKPIRKNVKVYAEIYELYLQLHDAFGRSDAAGDMRGVMKKLAAIRATVK